MQVTVTTADSVFALEVSPEIELENFKVLVQVESGVENMSNMAFIHNGRILMDDKKTLKDLGVVDNDVLVFESLSQGQMAMNPPQQSRPVSRPPASSAAGRSKIFTVSLF